MILGIEIGGTKLQLGVGAGDGSPLVVLQRQRVDPKRGAEGIREQIQHFAPPLIERYRPSGIGIGFGGPVDPAAGRVIKSHQVGGWDDFPLADWAQETLGLRSVVGNASDMAGLAGLGGNPGIHRPEAPECSQVAAARQKSPRPRAAGGADAAADLCAHAYPRLPGELTLADQAGCDCFLFQTVCVRARLQSKTISSDEFVSLR